MLYRENQNKRKAAVWTYPIVAAKKFIRLYEQLSHPNEEQRAMLAAAYFTLANQRNISSNRSRMHVNAAIALLKNIKGTERLENWNSQIAHAYFKRAEILEEKKQFEVAIQDYQHVIEALEQNKEKVLPDHDRLLLAQASISIADLIVNEQVEKEDDLFFHPLYYINKALEHLADMSNVEDDIWAIYAYAHQIAALSLSSEHFDEAKEAFRVALLMAFKTETVYICPLLVDIYTSLGLLYEEQYLHCSIQKKSDNLLQHATLYFGMSFLFSPHEQTEEDDILVLESLFEMIYRLLDPYLPPLSYQVICDLVDALIYTYLCVLDKVLPNQTLEHQLNLSNTLDMFAQHIYWLVVEAYYKKHPRIDMLEILPESQANFELNKDAILALLKNKTANNVHYFKNKNYEHIPTYSC